MMRSALFSLSLLVFAFACTASQAVSTSAPTSTVDKPALDSLAWTTDLKTANKIAADNDLRVLMVFSGSDWCRPCQAFKKEVLLNESFRNSAKDEVVVLYLDFPAKKRNQLPKDEMKRNAKLAEQYNQNGSFPTVLLMPVNETASPCELKYKGDGAEAWIKKVSKAVEECNA